MVPLPKGTLPNSPAASGDVDTIQLALGNAKTLDESWAFLKYCLEKARYAWMMNRLPTTTEDATAWAKENFKRAPTGARTEVIERVIWRTAKRKRSMPSRTKACSRRPLS